MKGLILGAGVTGLAASVASGWTAYEATGAPGGICSSYYLCPGDRRRLGARPADGEAYRFEIGGGHWIFGGDPLTLGYVERLTPLRTYTRRSSVYFPDDHRYVPYPLQNHLRHLGPDLAARALAEMAQPARRVRTMKEWLAQSFGPTLCERFFYPFHALYTAGLYERVAPQDAYKSPVDLALAVRGSLGDAPAVGYNVRFAYPLGGLDGLAGRMAAAGCVSYAKRATRIDLARKTVEFADGATLGYDLLLSTLPLNRTIAMAGVSVDAEPDPFTSVLVLNIGARRGAACPDDHWIYVPCSQSGFHRVGFYDNVDREFLPASARTHGDRTSLYVERAFVGGEYPGDAAVDRYADAVVRELTAWGFIDGVEVVDPTWIDVAYTWSWPGSRWTRLASEALARADVHPIGRYGRWVFQGIAESLREGFGAGAAVRVT